MKGVITSFKYQMRCSLFLTTFVTFKSEIIGGVWNLEHHVLGVTSQANRNVRDKNEDLHERRRDQIGSFHKVFFFCDWACTSIFLKSYQNYLTHTSDLTNEA